MDPERARPLVQPAMVITIDDEEEGNDNQAKVIARAHTSQTIRKRVNMNIQDIDAIGIYFLEFIKYKIY